MFGENIYKDKGMRRYIIRRNVRAKED